jgi:hypothetical protein
MMTAAELTRMLGGRWHGRYGTARCVIHDDRNPSLSIFEGGQMATVISTCGATVGRAVRQTNSQSTIAVLRVGGGGRK